MSKIPQVLDPRIIDSPQVAPDWGVWDARVQKIVIGEHETASALYHARKPLRMKEPLPEFVDRFPNLTHLYLWQIEGLQTLPALPCRLKCLEVRGCPDLVSLPQLPAGLETLILERCPLVAPDAARHGAKFAALTDFSVKGCRSIAQEWLDAVLAGATRLRWLDASDCPQFTRIAAWPPELVDVRLDGCNELRALPPQWPANLRCIVLRRASLLRRLPDFHKNLDYVNLAWCESLQNLPARRGHPRTLLLFGAGLLVPPASELGESATENVAVSTEEYFKDLELTGRGDVKRCKLLILGNGSAGKTCLSLALVPGKDPRDAEKLGTTHGIEFWDWDFTADIDGAMEPVHLHLWDFGGQEIYHNTHSLFMSKGAVFVVVWKPEQDGKQPEPTAQGYQDEWRPLQYWLDFIHLACPHKPRIAIICSHHAGRSDALEKQWLEQVSERYREECRCFYIDSWSQAGDLDELRRWLEKNTGEVIKTQGTAVPAYWEIAQAMVEGWVKQMDADAGFAARHNQIPPDRFRDALLDAIEKAAASGPQYRQLKAAMKSGRFELTDDRLRHTLSFLTHSGWIYWDPRLFEERVIVGQKWALKGIYAALDRRTDIYRHLVRGDGRFSLSQLGEWVWNGAGYSRAEQELLLSFMKRCQLCFQLRAGPDAWREEDVYLSFEHLPTAKELRLQRLFESRLTSLPLEERTLAVPGMHKQHWQAFLINAGDYYGKDAQYALDGFYVENEEGEKLLALCHLDWSGLGGEVEIQVGGANAVERLAAAVKHLKSFFPGSEDRPAPDPAQGLGKPTAKEEVFISYAWNPPSKAGESGIPPGYEEPVDAIDRFLKDKPVMLRRDKNVMRPGDDILKFMQDGPKCPHVIVVHSDKYWRSPDCIFELKMLFDQLRDEATKSFQSVVIPVEHLNSAVADRGRLEQYLEDWRNYNGRLPERLGWTMQELKDYAAAIMRDFSKQVSSKLGLNLSWKDGHDKVLAAIAQRLLEGRKN